MKSYRIISGAIHRAYKVSVRNGGRDFFFFTFEKLYIQQFGLGIKELFHCGKLSMKNLKEAARDRM